MTYFPVQPRYSVYIDSLGDPLDDGYIYLGKANLDPTLYPAKASWDEAGLYPITFPVRTMNGYPLRDGIPAQMYLNFADNTEYSVLVNDEDGVEVYSSTTGFSGYFPSGDGGDAATLGGELPSYYATDSLVAHLAGDETFTGPKTFTNTFELVSAAPGYRQKETDTDTWSNLTTTGGITYLLVGGVGEEAAGSGDLIFCGWGSTTNIGSLQVRFGGANRDIWHAGNLDFEESTFTPVVEGSTTPGVGTYSVQFGRYQKVGNWVHFRIQFTWTAHTGSGNIVVSGLPYTAHATRTSAVSLMVGGITYSGDSLGAIVVNSTDTILLYTYSSGVALSGVALPSTGNLYYAGSYEVA